MHAWFGVDQSPAVDTLLGMFFIDRSIQNIFALEQEIVPWNFRPMAIIKRQERVNVIAPVIEEVNVITMAEQQHPDRGAQNMSAWA